MIRNIKQSELIEMVAEKENMNKSDVRKVFKATENIVYDYLSSISYNDKCKISLLKGLSLESKYVLNKCSGIFKGTEYNKIKINSYISRRYKSLINR